MALVMSNEGGLELLDKMLKDALSVDENYVLKLFNASTITPAVSTSSASFAGATATFTNYSHKTLTRAGWNAATISSNTAVADYTTASSWTCGATTDVVYGYWIEGVTSNKVLWAEKFASPRTVANGDILNVTPRFTLISA
jgi:hypothetical protein